MELNPYESDLLVLDKELKRQEEEFLQSLIISYDEGVQTNSIETLKELQSSQEVIELYQRKSSAYRDELIPKQDDENYYYSDSNERYVLKLKELGHKSNYKDIITRDNALFLDLNNQSIKDPTLGELFTQLYLDIEEHMKDIKTEIARSKVKQQLENYMSMLNAFEPGSSSAEATQVHIGFYKRLLASL